MEHEKEHQEILDILERQISLLAIIAVKLGQIAEHTKGGNQI